MSCSTYSMEYSASRGTVFSTIILFSVMVPVLSTQSTSTRASVSIQSISWTSVFLCARRMTPAIRAMEVRRYSPSGIIPMMEPTVDVTAVATSRPSHVYSLMNMIAARGITKMPIHLMRFVRDRIISDWRAGFAFFASSVSFAAKESAPTSVRRARQVPLITKLPDISLSPVFFRISSDSPVISASLAWTEP